MLATLRNIFLTKQRGAMFGMDARVALLVFGSIALIGGYSMISRIGTAHAAKLVRELQALEKAFTALQTDLGQPVMHADTLGITTSDTAALFNALRRNPDSDLYPKWNGPYLNEDYPISHATYGTWSSDWGKANFTDKSMCSGALTTCYLWITLSDVPENVFREVNLVIDENGGDLTESNPETDGRVTYSGTTMNFRVVGWDARAGRTVK